VRTGKVNSLDRPFTGQCLITVQTLQMERIKERKKIVSKCNAQMERIKERRKIISKCNVQMKRIKKKKKNCK
jgi:hypothetical protein